MTGGSDLESLPALADFEDAARKRVDPAVWAYVAGGAGEGRTVRANAEAFEALWLEPRVLASECTRAHTATLLLGHEVSMPVLLAPTSPQRLLHEEAELATARAAGSAGVVHVVSADSHYPFAAIAGAGTGPCWFQLYAYGSQRNVDAAVALAEEGGASALVVTVDAAHSARRLAARRAGFRAPADVEFGTLRALGILNGSIPASARLERLPLTWRDLERIRDRTALPLVVKGVLRADDARGCVDLGADGVIVSNHGGRQLDAVIPSLVALERVATEVHDDCTVLLDGGVRSGIDVVKALALGARAICVGRPYLWGLALAGQAGVEAVLALLRAELEDALLQLGVTSVRDVGPACVGRAGGGSPSSLVATERR